MANENISENTIVTHLEFSTLPGVSTVRNYKDSLFRLIYSGKDERSRRWLLSLYNALSGKNYTDINDLRITTIDNVIYLTMKNDLSFLLDSQMNLFEHQSSVNPNMPLRGLMYFGQLYQNEVKRQKKDLFGKSLIKIPSPRFIVFYNGEANLPDTKKYYLSDAFIKPSDLTQAAEANKKNDRKPSVITDNLSGKEFEWTATLININKGHNKAIQKNCESLYHYVEFVARVRDNQDRGLETPLAVNEAVDYAIKKNFLEGFFGEQKMYITNSLLTEFDQELHDRCTREDGYEEGLAAGAQQTAIASARNLLSMNLGSPEQIAHAVALPLEQVLALKKELES